MISIKQEGHREWEEVPVARGTPLMRQINGDKVRRAVHIRGLWFQTKNSQSL